MTIPNSSPVSSTTNTNFELPSTALTGEQSAAMFNVSTRHWLALRSAGKTPKSVKLGASVRWLRRELEAWADAGCPPLDEWERLRDSSKGGGLR